MKDGIFHVNVFDAKTDEIFLETELNGESYVIAEPDNEYYVTVSIHRSSLNQPWPYDYIRIGLFVDGDDVAYWKRLDFTEPVALKCTSLFAKFWGFKENETQFRSFVFTDPSKVVSRLSSDTTITSASHNNIVPSSSSSSSNNFSKPNRPVGQIRVIIHDAIVTNGVFENKCGKAVIPASTSLKEGLSDDRKFWLQPSIGTTAGNQVVGKDEFKPIKRWMNKSTTPLRTLLLTYHTKQSFELLQKFTHENKEKQKQRLNNNNNLDNEHLSKRIKGNPIVVDLTEEDDDEEEKDDDNESNRNNNNHIEEYISDEVIMVTKPRKPVPIINIDH